MKRIVYAFLIVISLIAVSCQELEVNEQNLIGTWEMTDWIVPITYMTDYEKDSITGEVRIYNIIKHIPFPVDTIIQVVFNADGTMKKVYYNKAGEVIYDSEEEESKSILPVQHKWGFDENNHLFAWYYGDEIIVHFPNKRKMLWEDANCLTIAPSSGVKTFTGQITWKRIK